MQLTGNCEGRLLDPIGSRPSDKMQVLLANPQPKALRIQRRLHRGLSRLPHQPELAHCTSVLDSEQGAPGKKVLPHRFQQLVQGDGVFDDTNLVNSHHENPFSPTRIHLETTPLIGIRPLVLKPTSITTAP